MNHFWNIIQWSTRISQHIVNQTTMKHHCNYTYHPIIYFNNNVLEQNQTFHEVFHENHECSVRPGTRACVCACKLITLGLAFLHNSLKNIQISKENCVFVSDLQISFKLRSHFSKTLKTGAKGKDHVKEMLLLLHREFLQRNKLQHICIVNKHFPDVNHFQ